MESGLLDAGPPNAALVEARGRWPPTCEVEVEGRMPDAADRNAELVEDEVDRWKWEWEVGC